MPKDPSNSDHLYPDRAPGFPKQVQANKTPPEAKAPAKKTTPPAGWRYDYRYEGGEKGCGELILELRQSFSDLPPGSRVLVVAQDPGAPIDIPAWCRLTGHKYLDEAPPYYLIERK